MIDATATVDTSRERLRRDLSDLHAAGVKHGRELLRNDVMDALNDARMYDAIQVILAKIGPA